MLMQLFRRLWIEIVKGEVVCVAGNEKELIFDYARVFGIFWKCARVGERLSPYVSLCCIVMAVRTPRML